MTEFDPAAVEELETLDPLVRRALLRQAQKQVLEEGKFYRMFPDDGPLGWREYKKHVEFFNAGAGFMERLFMAANRVGKTEGGAYESVCHLTGIYPSWWQGKKFPYAVDGWTAGDTALTVRDIQQLKLMGKTGQFGTGLIPKELIVRTLPRPGVPDGIESVHVKHISGGISTLGFRSYDQGREAFQGTAKHFVWPDEEPPPDIYIEMLTRTMDVGGIVYMTFTPLRGLSPVVLNFMPGGRMLKGEAGKYVVNADWDDAPHLSAEAKKKLWDAIPAHERDARAKGLPQFGSGRVFAIAEEGFKEAGIVVPPHWAWILGTDFGYDHPTAGAWIAYDRDADVAHVVDVYRKTGPQVLLEQGVVGTPIVHAAAFKRHGAWVPVAWPMDALQHDKGSGMQLAQQYRDQGLNMLHEHAAFDQLGQEDETRQSRVSVEAGIAMMLDRMQTGRLRVAGHLQEFWEEFRLYHRKDGKIVKLNDDVISAVRYGLMMLRYAQTPPVSSGNALMGRRRAAPNWRAV